MPASTVSPVPGFHAVVPAGGAGTRLWPLSRAGHPKFLLDLTGTGRTLLQGTVDRLLPLTGPGGVLVVTGQRHAQAVAAQLPELGPGDVLAEPSPRDSMAAIGLAAAVLVERMQLVNDYRHFPFRDPDLPPDLLPADWSGRRAHETFLEAHGLLRQPAEEWVDAVVGEGARPAAS